MLPVAQRIHGLPKPFVAIGDQLMLSCQRFQRPLFPDSLWPAHQIQHRRVSHKEATVDPPAVTCWLLLETGHQIPIKLQRAKTLAEGELVLLRERLVAYHQQGFLVIRLLQLLPVGFVQPGQVDSGALGAGAGG